MNITNTESGEYSAVWRPDGKKIGFLSTESGKLQLWEMNPDGSDRKQISDIEVFCGRVSSHVQRQVYPELPSVVPCSVIQLTAAHNAGQ